MPLTQAVESAGPYDCDAAGVCAELARAQEVSEAPSEQPSAKCREKGGEMSAEPVRVRAVVNGKSAGSVGDYVRAGLAQGGREGDQSHP